jgi:ERCC4-type nuclease
MVSPAEPPELRKIGKVNPLPERHGVDFAWLARDLLHGAQRKTITDLIASASTGDRLTRELGQMQGLATKLLIVEGNVGFTTEGLLLGTYRGSWTMAQWYGLLLSIQQRGVWVLNSPSIGATAKLLPLLERWTAKERHTSLTARNGPVSAWGRPDNRDWQMHVLTSLPGISAVLAGRVLDHFGRMPIEIAVSREDLLKVEGLGPKKVDAILKCLSAG